MQAFSRLVQPKYDVFICFRGVDTRYSFTGYLYKDLCGRGFRTFLDNREIEKGSRITLALPKAIEASRIFIVVLSLNFASSSYCLIELEKILEEFEKGMGRWVLPVFYHVDPSTLVDTYKQALADQEEWYSAEMIERWRIALNRIAQFSGCHIVRDGGIEEWKHIEHIVKEVSRHVSYPVGLHRRVSKVNSLLNQSDAGARMVVICGEPEIGKSTLARAVFNLKAGGKFDWFVENAGEIIRERGIIYLQQMLLSEKAGHNVAKFENVNEGLSILNQMKVFMILEDISNSKQMKDIIGLTNQLGSGSKVIVTTRDKCLPVSHGIKSIYEVESLEKEEAFELLSRKAFNSTKFSVNYVDILILVETYACGHPRTLELIGSNLWGKSVEDCECVLVKYNSIKNTEMQKILEESFNSLERCQQRMLIHIALFPKELELVVVEEKLRNKFEGCPKENIRVLLDKSLIKINDHGQVTLNRSTRDMIRNNTPHFEEYAGEESYSPQMMESMTWNRTKLEYQFTCKHCSFSSWDACTCNVC